MSGERERDELKGPDAQLYFPKLMQISPCQQAKYNMAIFCLFAKYTGRYYGHHFITLPKSVNH